MEIFAGKITDTFGIKGELKVATNFEMAERVFKPGNKVVISGQWHEITSVRYHKKQYLITIDHLTNINLVLIYKGNNLYFKREDLGLKEGEYLLTDLIGFTVWEGETGFGLVTEIINDSHNPLLKVEQSFYIPLNGDFIQRVDLKAKRVIGQRIKELKL